MRLVSSESPRSTFDHGGQAVLAHSGPGWQSPAPFLGAEPSHDDHVLPAQRFSAEDTAPPIGRAPHASRLVIFLRRQAPGGSPRRLPSERVAIHDAEGRELTAITEHNAVIDHDVGYVAYSCTATPGTYRLRATRSRRDAAIVVPAGRTALVFVADTGSVRLTDLRQALVPIGDRFDPRSPIWSAMEHVIAALRVPDGTLPLAARRLLPDAAEQDLCFGIAAAHVLWRAGDRLALAEVIRHLVRYREIPDVAILARLADGAAHAPDHRPPAELADTPPLLRASLTLALTRPELDPGSLSAYSAFAHVARTGLHDSVWSVWSLRAWDERWIEPAVERLRGRSRQRDVTAIARSLALATETVEQVVQAIEAATPGAGQPGRLGPPGVPGYLLAAPALGRGLRSTVYRATRLADQHEVALKIVPVGGGAERCAHALEALDRCNPIDHPRLLSATARGALPDGSGIWLEMERCDGSVLDLLSDEDAAMPPAEARRIVLDALGVLAHLHAGGVAHGDIKPSNLLVRSDRSAALAGPGLAVRHAIPDAVGHATDAPRFVPAELLRSRESPSPAADVWAMAATLYFMLTLEFPREEYADQSQLDAALDNSIVSLARRRPDLPPELTRLIDTALSPAAGARPPDAGALRTRLAAIDLTGPVAKPVDRIANPRHQGTRPRSHRGIRSLVAAATPIIGLLAWLMVPSSSDSCEADPRFRDLRRRSEACLASYRETGNDRDLALATRADLALGHTDLARGLAYRLLAGSRSGDGYAALGQIALDANDIPQATWYLGLARDAHIRSGDARGLVDDAVLLSRARSRLPDFEAALQAADEAVDRARQLHDRHAEVTALAARAEVLRGVGDVHEARRALTLALDLATEPCDQGWTRLQTGLCLIDAGQDSVAMAHLDEAEHANATCGDRNLGDSVSLNKAWLVRRRDPVAAGTRLQALSSSAGGQPRALVLRSYLAADRGDLEAAVRYLDRVERDSAADPDWAWATAWARAELAEQRHGVLDDLLAEYHYRRATALIAALRATARTRSAYLITSRRGPYDGLLALLARQARWRDALAVVLELDASDMLRSTAHPVPGAVATTPPAIDDVVSAWRARDVIVVIAPSPHRIGPGHERAYRLRISDGQVTGADIGEAGLVRSLAEHLFGKPDDATAARSLGSMLIPSSSDPSTLYVLAIGALRKTPLPALRDVTGSLVIARRPLARVTALATIAPESRGAGRPVIIADPRGMYPGSASEAAIAARAVKPDADLAASRFATAATRSQLWSARDAELLHVSAPTVVRGPWRALALADGDVEPADMIRHGLAPRLAVISGNGSATAMDEEGWGSLASALLESGTEMVIATDRSVEDQPSLALITAFYAQHDWATHPARALAHAQVALAGEAGGAVPWSTWAAFGALARPPVISRGSGGGGAPWRAGAAQPVATPR